jgi:PKD repeat protein
MNKNYFLTVVLSLFVFMPFGILQAQAQQPMHPTKIITPTHFDVSQNLRDVDPIPPGYRTRSWKDNLIKNEEGFLNEFSRPSVMTGPDPVLQDAINSTRETNVNVGQNFAGVNNKNGVAPPDTDGDVGPNHYFQMVNLSYAVWDKNGNQLLAPADNQTIWEGFDDGQPYDNANDGDPIVLYDSHADRWLVSQFAINTSNNKYYELVAISTTADPTGSWYRYAFEFDNMPDYPKFGIWPDGYYLSVNQFANGSSWAGGGIAVLDRDAMIAGNANATMIFWSLGTSYGSLLPADCDGDWPSAGTPNYFVNLGTNLLRVWEVSVDWNNTSNSTATLVSSLTTADFSNSSISVAQPGTTTKLDNLADRLMNRLQYRNFGDHQSMVTNHTVNVGSGRAGVRWYELRNTGSGWSIYQQGTYAPNDGDSRWMASIAMNGNGDIGLGFSVSGSNTYPSIRVAGQTAGAPDGLGVLDIPEATIVDGNASQTGVTRWGDYSMLSVDPNDDATFWYTTEYTTGGWNWVTRIASFSFSVPAPTPPTANFSADATNISTGGAVHFQDQSTGNPTSWSWSFPGGTPNSSTDQNPTVYYNTAGTYDVTLTVSNAEGNDTKTMTNYITVEDAPITYCDSKGNSQSYEWIAKVQFGDFTNSTGATPYSDFTNMTISMEAGASVSGTLTPGFASSSYDEYWKVWIDYNKNGDFTDPGEEVISGHGQSAVTGSFTVPDGVTGTTRMRVSMKWDAYPTPCESFSYGEVEDYTVEFTTSVPVAPVADFSANATTVAEGAIVNFTDQSSNVPTSWAWTFNGGDPASSTAQNPSVQYNNAGTYTVELTATNDAGSDTETKADYITVMKLPVADFTSNVTVIDKGQSVQFTDQSTDATSWSWSFDGGTPSTSTAQNPTVTYNTAGTFTVELTATNAVGSDTKTKTSYITVNEVVVAPVANFTASATSVTEGSTVTFTDQSTNDPTSWSWSFDGGTPSTSTAQNPTVTYNTAGTYDVTLTATNSAGSDSETKTGYITVTAAPSEVTLSFTDFESGWGIWKDGGGDCKFYTGGNYAWSGSNAADIQDNSGVSSSFYMTNGVDVHTPGYVQLQVEFYFVGISMETGEDFWVQYYNGSSWHTVADFARGTDFNNNTFYVATVTILESNYTFPTNMKLRFMCDASGNWDDVYIDDITVTASTSVTNGPVHQVTVKEIGNRFIPEGDDEFTIYPNPANDVLFITSEEQENADVYIYNTSGQLVMQTLLKSGNERIDISKLEKGLYLINIQSGDEVFTKKIIKK